MQTSAMPRGLPAALTVHKPVAAPLASAVPLDLHARAGEAAALLKALANADRLLLLCQLVGAERSVSELGLLTGIGQPSLSQQLGVLRGERLVANRRVGKQVIYRIASPAAMTVLQALYALFCAPGLVQGQAAARSVNRSGKQAQ